VEEAGQGGIATAGGIWGSLSDCCAGRSWDGEAGFAGLCAGAVAVALDGRRVALEDSRLSDGWYEVAGMRGWICLGCGS